METGTWTEEMIKLMSPVAWQHINLMGRYEFNKKEEKLDLNDITDVTHSVIFATENRRSELL